MARACCSVWSSLILFNTQTLSFSAEESGSKYTSWELKAEIRVLLTVVQGQPLPSQTLSKTQSKPGRCHHQRQCQPSCGHFHLLSSLTWVSGRWESIFISGLFPADCDSSVHALCKLNLTSTVLLKARFSFYRCFLLRRWRIDAATFSKHI